MEIARNLNFIPGHWLPVHIPCSQYDTRRKFIFTLYDGEEKRAVPSEAIVEIRGLKPDKNGFAYNSKDNPDVVYYEASVVTVQQTPDTIQMTACAGLTACELRIMSGTGRNIGTANFFLDIEEMPGSDEQVKSSTDIYNLLETLTAAKEDAETAADDAQEAEAYTRAAMTQLADYKTPPERTTFIAQTYGENLFNKNAVTPGYTLNAAGEVVENEHYSLSDFIPVTAGETYSMSARENRAYYDGMKRLLTGEGYSTGNQTTAPERAAYIRLGVNNGNVETLTFAPGSTTPESGLSYSRTDTLDSVEVPAGQVKGDLTGATIPAGQVHGELTGATIDPAHVYPDGVDYPDTAFFTAQYNRNLFNKYTTRAGARVGTNGAVVEDENYMLSDYIPVTAGTVYTMTDAETRAYYDSEKTLTAWESYTAGKTTTAPEGAAYIRVGVRATRLAVFQLAEGDAVPATYDPVLYRMDAAARIPWECVEGFDRGYINARQAGLIPGDETAAAANLAVMRALARTGERIYIPAGVYSIGGYIEFVDRMYIDMDSDAELKLTADLGTASFIRTRATTADAGNDWDTDAGHMGPSYIHGGSINADFKAGSAIRILGLKKFDLSPRMVKNFTKYGIYVGASQGYKATGTVHDCNVQNRPPESWKDRYPKKADGTIDYTNRADWPTDTIYGIFEDNTSDNRYKRLIIHGVNVGLYVGDAFVEDVHVWTSNQYQVPGSAYAVIKGTGGAIFSQCMIDTLQHGFKAAGASNRPHIVVQGARIFDNTIYYDDVVAPLYPHTIFSHCDRVFYQVFGVIQRATVPTVFCDALPVREGSHFYGLDITQANDETPVEITNIPPMG